MTDQTRIDALRHAPIAPQKLLIDGETCDSASGKADDIISPLDGKRFLCSEITSDIERLDVERYSQNKSHGMIPLSQ